MNGQFSIGAVTPARYFLGLSSILGLLFALIADSENGFFVDVLQWQLQTLLPVSILLWVHLLLCEWRKFNSLNAWLKLFLSGVLGALMFSPTALLIDHFFLGDPVLDGFWSNWLDESVGVVPAVTLAWIGMNSPWVLGYRLQRDTDSFSANRLMPDPEIEKVAEQEAEPDVHKPEPGFMQLVERNKRGTLLYLKAELHYMSVVTERGSSLILYSLRDAVLELDALGISGAQAHRSYWVAESAIQAFKKSGRQGIISVSNGDQIPVSRTNMEKFNHH